MEKNYGSHIDFPSNWKVERLKDNFSIYPTASYSRADLTEDGPVKYIHYGDIHTQFDFHLDVQKNNLPRITEEQIKKYQLVEEGDLVIADASEDYEGVGKAVEVINVNNEKVIAGLHTFLIRDNAKVFAPKFKGYALLSSYVREQMYRLATGTKVYSISKESLKDIKIPVPPIEEQNAIANCLSIWDKVIEKQQKLIEAKEIRHKALMQKLLSGKKRLPGFTDEWKQVKLGDLFSERNETKYDDLPLLSIGQEGVYPQTDSNKRDISNGDKSKYKRIVPGDIGYNTMRMWQGRSALSSLEGIVSPAYTILIPKENVDSYFFSLLFKTTRLTNLFWRNSQGLVDDTLNCKYKDFSIIKCNIPSYEEQIAIKEILKISEAEIEIEKKKLDQLKEQKKALMQKLLTGKVRLPLNN